MNVNFKNYICHYDKIQNTITNKFTANIGNSEDLHRLGKYNLKKEIFLSLNLQCEINQRHRRIYFPCISTINCQINGGGGPNKHGVGKNSKL